MKSHLQLTMSGLVALVRAEFDLKERIRKRCKIKGWILRSGFLVNKECPLMYSANRINLTRRMV